MHGSMFAIELKIKKMIQKAFLTFNEIIFYTGLSRTTIYKLISQKKLHPTKPTGGRVFFSKHEVDMIFLASEPKIIKK